MPPDENPLYNNFNKLIRTQKQASLILNEYRFGKAGAVWLFL